MIYHVLLNRKSPFPFISFLLGLSCVITTVPQFFLSGSYDFITGDVHLRWWRITLPQFSHTPDQLVPHFVTNTFFILFLGALIERTLGAHRFSFLSVSTFLVIELRLLLFTLINRLGTFHGASGICWGYIVLVLPMLVKVWKRNKWRNLFDPIFILAVLSITFMLLGIPLLAWLVAGESFWTHFTNTSHLLSIATAIPFFFLWRKVLAQNLDCVLENQPISTPSEKRYNIPLALAGALFLLNLGATVYASHLSLGAQATVIEMAPPPGTPIDQVGDAVRIIFDEPMKREEPHETGHSIWCAAGLACPTYRFEWLDDRTLLVQFDRKLVADENLTITVIVFDGDGLPIKEPIEIHYE